MAPAIYDASFLERIEPLLLHARTAIVGWDRNLRISYWSRSATNLFGIEAEEALGKTVEESALVHPADRTAVAERSSRLRERRQHERVNINRNIRSDGRTIVCRWTRATEQDDDRLSIVSFVEDITREYAARDSILESEARFRALFADNPDPIIIVDRDGYIADVNEAALEAPGARFADLLGRHFHDFLPADLHAEHDIYFARANSGITQEYDVVLPSSGGSTRYLSIKSLPLFERGEFAGMYSILHDDTDQRKEREALATIERERYESVRRLRSLFEANPDGVVAIDRSGIITEANNAAARIGGYEVEALQGRSFEELVTAAFLSTAQRHFAKAISGEGCSLALECYRLDGSAVPLDVTLIPQYSGDEIIGVYAILQDVTLRQEARQRADREARRVRDLYAIASAAGDPLEGMVEALRLGCRIFGARSGSVAEISGRSARAVARADGAESAELDPALATIAAQIVASTNDSSPISSADVLAVPIDIAGERYGAVIFSEFEAGQVFTDTDVEFLGLLATLVQSFIERSRVRLHLQRMAYVDALTGLPNGSGLRERLRTAIDAAPLRMQRVAVLFLGLDRFKDINETLGHRLGDRLLQAVGTRIEALFASLGTVARMGGDEFAILLHDAGTNDRLRDVAEQVINALEEPFAIDDFEQFLSASIGIAVYPEDGLDSDALVKNADIAMSRAKDRGRGGVYFYNATLEAPILMRLTQERLLRRALERNEFRVYYQPQIDLVNGSIVGAEALVRWQHPGSGLIEPGHFIPSAEISGLIVHLGRWVLKTATLQASAWVKRFGPLRLAVNLSARQLHHRHVRGEIMAALDHSGLEPSLLEIEITESVAMSDVEQAIAIVREIKGSGVRTAIDDFGTGYSSLAYLRRFAFDVLKIDGSFVEGIGREREDETIVKTLVGMSASLGLETVAECVEREEQAVFLRDYGCRLAQGFLYSAALPATEFEAMLAATNGRDRDGA